MAERIPGARFVEVAGRDFNLHTEGGSEVAARVQEFLTGRLPEVEPDRVLATVVFTDIVSSTERAAEMGDRKWRDLLDEHDRTAAQLVEAHRGRLIKTTGDGILATFDGPARAIHATNALGTAAVKLGIRIRAGLHTGEVELRGDDIGGIAVNLASRVLSQAGASEILVSNTVKDLVIGSGLEFDDRGVHTLKGIPGEWRLFAVKS